MQRLKLIGKGAIGKELIRKVKGLVMVVEIAACLTGLPSTACIAAEIAEDDVYIDAVATVPDEELNCQINLTAFLPEKFGLDCYADIRNMDTHRVYRLSLHPENDYTQICYVEPGTYMVTNIGVFDDSTGKYEFLFPEDFILSEGEAVDLITMLSDEEGIQNEIDERLGKGGTSSASDENDFLTMDEGDKGQEFSVGTDFEVEHTGEGRGKVGIKGGTIGEYEVSIMVVKGGIPGTMTVKYSLTGESGLWSDEIAVPLAGNIDLYDLGDGGSKKDSGLKAYFAADPRDQDSLFVAGDTYTAYVPDPSTDLVIKHKGDGSAVLEIDEIRRGMHAFHLIYDGGYSIKAEVLKGGSFADAVVHVSTDGGKTYDAEMVVPEDGVIRLDDIGIMLCFTGLDSTSLFVTGDIYSVDAVKEDYLPLIIGVSAFLMGVLAVLYVLFRRYMMNQLPGASAYRIEEYTPFAEREKTERRLV